MFGYIAAFGNALSEEQKRVYRAFYCGLCRSLRCRHGIFSRGTLSFDMTFLSVLLWGVYDGQARGQERCFLHPVHTHAYIGGAMTDYAADMNLLLSYYHFLDDWHDDKNAAAFLLAKGFCGSVARLEKTYPRQCAALRNSLSKLSDYEKSCETNPDLPAACFGRAMGEIFAPLDDEFSDGLRRFGNALGTFIYIMDACMDLRLDLKRGRYNPLYACTADFKMILDMLLAECVQAYRALELKRYNDLIENVLYLGVWQQYERKKQKERKK